MQAVSIGLPVFAVALVYGVYEFVIAPGINEGHTPFSAWPLALGSVVVVGLLGAGLVHPRSTTPLVVALTTTLFRRALEAWLIVIDAPGSRSSLDWRLGASAVEFLACALIVWFGYRLGEKSRLARVSYSVVDQVVVDTKERGTDSSPPVPS